MQLEVISPEKTVYQGEIKLLQLPGTKGSFEILHNHAAIISTLEKGSMKIITNEGATHMINISGGIVEVLNNKIIVLAEM